jgi:hypothetical protein
MGDADRCRPRDLRLILARALRPLREWRLMNLGDVDDRSEVAAVVPVPLDVRDFPSSLNTLVGAMTPTNSDVLMSRRGRGSSQVRKLTSSLVVLDVRMTALGHLFQLEDRARQ